ncbi:hypothetical protein JXO52_12550 [bacterium]|nr:hypothetical protein [bacterium]
MKPKVTLPGHMMELEHLDYGSGTPYRDPIASDNGNLVSDYYILGWGERYHYEYASDDTISPGGIENATYSFLKDSVAVSWDAPAAADDGDTASFYRVLVNNTQSFWVFGREFHFPSRDETGYNVKIFSYDDCGNQTGRPGELSIVRADLDGDGDVDIADVQMVAGRWGCCAGDANYLEPCDVDGDGDIDIVDVQMVAGMWGTAI